MATVSRTLFLIHVFTFLCVDILTEVKVVRNCEFPNYWRDQFIKKFANWEKESVLIIIGYVYALSLIQFSFPRVK